MTEMLEPQDLIIHETALNKFMQGTKAGGKATVDGQVDVRPTLM